MATSNAECSSHCLIGGMDIREFDANVRERRAATFRGALGPDRLERLFSVPRLESLFRADAIAMDRVDLFDHGLLRRLADVQLKSGKSPLAVVAESFRRGSTIRVRDLDSFDAPLNRFVRDVRRCFAARSQANVYLTPPDTAGFPPHFDITDVFIVQCAGKKEWRLFPEYSNRIDLPLPETSWDPDRFRPSGSHEAVTLAAGDVLYLPRGTMHEAFCTDRESMHLTLSLAPLTFAELVAKALERAAEADVALRRRVPWPIRADGPGEGDLAARVRECLRDLAERVDVGALLLAERRSLQAEGEAAPSGELLSAIADLVAGERSDASTAAPQSASSPAAGPA